MFFYTVEGSTAGKHIITLTHTQRFTNEQFKGFYNESKEYFGEQSTSIGNITARMCAKHNFGRVIVTSGLIIDDNEDWDFIKFK